jgi:hypothetical protein
MKEVVYDFLEKEYQEIMRVHQLRTLFERYTTMSSDLVEEYQKKYTRPTILIVSALYTADYTIMSSEVKFELEDHIRRKEIIEFLMNLNLPNEEMWYEVTYLIAFTYKVTSLMRKRWHYLLDRGVAKHIAAGLVADYFARHLLDFVREKLNYLPQWWVTYLMETALCQSIFSKTQEKWANKQSSLHSNEAGLIAHLVFSNFIKETEGEPNPAVPIPYLNETNLFYYFTWERDGAKGERFESILPGNKTNQLFKDFKKTLPLLGKNYPHILKYLRLASKDSETPSETNLFIVHAKTENAEGWMGLVSPIDDINFIEIEALLRQKVEDIRSFSFFNKDLPTIDMLHRKKEERQIIEEEIEKEGEIERKGLFARFLSIFKKKKKVKAPSKAIARVQPFDTWTRQVFDELIIASVSGIGLGLEIYDTYREDSYVISGVIESLKRKEQPSFVSEADIGETRPTSFYSEKSVKFPSEFLDPIISIIDIARVFIPACMKREIISIIPEEAFYEVKDTPNLFRLVEFVSEEKIVIGILAEIEEQTAITYAKGEPKYQRRSLQRKAREILHARRVNTIIDSGKRTLAREIDWDNVSVSFEDRPLFFLKD